MMLSYEKLKNKKLVVWVLYQLSWRIPLGVVHILRNQYFGIFYTPPPSVIKRNHGFYESIAYIT